MSLFILVSSVHHSFSTENEHLIEEEEVADSILRIEQATK